MRTPTTVARLTRSRLTLAAIILLAALNTAVGQTADVARVRLIDEVAANWRGAYDILVRPPGQRLELETTNGLVEPNFLGFGGQGGISLDQLGRIRSLPEVELAAPVAIVGLIRYSPVGPHIYTDRYPAKPTLFGLDIRTSSSDGLGEILVQRQRAHWLLGPPTGNEVLSLADVQSGGGGAAEGVEVVADVLPRIASPIMAVDPASERLLLGPSGEFLDAFGRIASREGVTVAAFDTRLVDKSKYTSEYYGMLSFREDQPDLARQRPVVPILVSDRLYAPLTITLGVTQLGDPLAQAPSPAERRGVMDSLLIAEIARRAGPGTTVVGENRLDATALLRPFTVPSIVVPMPGSNSFPGFSAGGAGRLSDEYRTSLAARPVYDGQAGRPGGSALAFRIEPAGLVDPSGIPADRATATRTALGGTELTVGREQSYRAQRDLPLAANARVDIRKQDRPFFFAPIGEFDLGDLELPDNPLDYVPLGAYDPPATELVAEPDGSSVSPRPMTPTLDPAGLIAVPPLAITDLEGAVTLRGGEPIDAIRVRVRGITGYDPASVALVERVASRIAELGLEVGIVAGSSPQPVEVYVPAYHVETDPPTDLGWIRQRWTTLGAAERVERGLGGTNTGLLGLGLLTALTFAVALQMVGLAARTREAAILRAIGWRRRPIVRWLTAEAVLGGALVALAGLAAWWLGRGGPAALATVLALAAVLPLAALVGARIAWRRARVAAVQSSDLWLGVPRLRASGVDGPAGYGLRAALARPIRSVALVVALALAASALSLGAFLVLTTATRVGPTLLAAALSESLRPHQLALLGLSALGGLLLTILLLRLELADRAGELRVLAAAGWRPRTVAAMLRAARLAIALPAALLAGILGAFLAAPVSTAPPAPTALLAALLAGSVVLWGGLLARPWRTVRVRA